jgi:1-deoxy-D-xylulose-5-phosphate synthase
VKAVFDALEGLGRGACGVAEAAADLAILDGIDSPADLRRLPPERLPDVAAALRRVILDTVSRTGGHLAASLGAVELATALHYAFDTPRDRLLWDVGHQGYPHKLLTGRRHEFARIGRAGGIGKFLRRSESPYDVFGAGHAGTSISAAVGIAEAIRRRGGDERVIAVIGDGAMTAGMAFEGLNNAGFLRLGQLLVVLNDNEMSISPNVGALSVAGSAAAFFAALGFDAIGPVDGHDLAALGEAFARVRARRRDERPVLVHCRTRKGHGYAPAVRDPVAYHGVGAFEVGSGALARGKPGPPSWTSVFADALAQLADEDSRIVALTAAMADGTGLTRFAATHPDRCYDVGIAEQHAVTMAAGMATEGLKPVCAIYSTFLQRAFDQIVHDVCVQDLDVTFAVDRAGLVGADGATHQGLYDLAYLRTLPNMVVMAPKDENELRRMLRTAIEHPGPAALRFPRGAAPGAAIDASIEPLAVGRAELLRDGGDVALIAIGAMVPTAIRAAAALAENGIDAAVLNARFVKPLDARAIVRLARRVGAVVTVEEHAVGGGFGEAVTSLLAAYGVPVPTRILAVPDRVVEHADPEASLAAFGLDAEGVARAARELCERARPVTRRRVDGRRGEVLPWAPPRSPSSLSRG